MNFLTQKNPLIRSQLLPVDVDFDAFTDRLINFILQMTEEKLGKDQTLEIEVKLGAFFQREASGYGFQQYLDNFCTITKYNHTILNDFQQNYMFQPCFTFHPWSELVFDSTPHPQPFQHLLWYLSKLCKPQTFSSHEKQVESLYVYPDKIQCLSPIEQSIRLDFHFASGDRGSVLLRNKQVSCEILRKIRQGDMDIMKGESQFRITGQIESIIDQGDIQILQDRLMNGEQVRQIRFKSILSFRFQFIRVDASRVHHIKNENVLHNIGKIKWDQLLLGLLHQLHDVDEWEQTKQQQYLRKKTRILESKRKSEVELEIVDLDFVKTHPDAAVKRLLRNVDSFFYIDRVHRELLVMKIQERCPSATKQQWQPPLIGGYQYKIYQKNHKLKNKHL